MSERRPIYENMSTKEAEEEVMEAVSRHWSCAFHKLPRSYHLDYALIRHERVQAFAEIKCRTNRHLAYPTYMIAAQKVERAMSLTRSTGLPSLLIVRWTDVAGWIDIGSLTDSPQLDVRIGGRKDRGDSADIEPVIHYDICDFSLFPM